MSTKNSPPHRPFLRLVGAEPDDENHTGVWQDGPSFIVLPNSQLPDRCLKCGDPTGGWTRKKTLFWHSPLWFGLLPILFGLVYFVVVSMVKRSVVLHIPLCSAHRQLYRLLTVSALALIPSFPILLIAGILEANAPFLILGVLFSLTGLVLLIWSRNPIWATQINDQSARIRGAHSSWLERLPPWRRAS